MVLLATTAPGIARAERGTDGSWAVRRVCTDVDVTFLARDPREAATVWAATRSGVLRSSDRGATWQPAGLEGVDVKSLSVDPSDGRVVYAGVKPAGVRVTRDAGASWQELTGFHATRRWWWWSPADPPGVQPYVSAIGVSPTDPDVVVAGVELGAVVRSEDGGRTWSAHRARADRDCHALTFHVRDGDWVYEAGGGGPAVSRDGGRTWRHPLSGLAGRYAMACAADPVRPEVWYLSAAPIVDWRQPWRVPLGHHDGHAQASIYRSSGGAAWERLGGGLPRPLEHMAYGLVTDPDHAGHVYAGLANGQVWHSRDYGDRWEPLPLDLGGVRRSLVLA
jgi:hypothetical protein